MHAAAINLRGGVSPRGTLLRGQSVIEYVLIIAIIGLVIVFAGPGVAGAIRNQFNLVGNTVNNGTTGGVEGGASGGGSAGADSATVQAAVAKDAKDWTLEEQKAVAEDIASKGEASQTLEYRIIGINHDDLADGTGKAGLTFLTTSTDISSRMNAMKTSDGGWEASELRAKMNSGEIWNLMPADFQSKVKSVRKLTNNVGGGNANKNAAVTATSDKLFLLSYSEIVPTSHWASDYPWSSSEGTQYEAFKGKVMNSYSDNPAIASGSYWWERSVRPDHSTFFLRVHAGGDPAISDNATVSNCVRPAWCF